MASTQAAMSLAEAAGLRRGDRVALIGSGGKTTLLFRLARESRGSVLLTTTTKMFPPPEEEEIRFLEYRGWEEFFREWTELRPRRALVAGRGEGKLRGLAPEEVDALARLEALDLLAVEADGSRGLPVKAHASFEPVLFSACTVGLAVLGMRALGRRIVEGQVHRPEILAPLTGLVMGDPLDVEALVRVLTAPGGYLDRLAVPRQVVALTQVDDPFREEAARALAARAGVPVLGLGGAFPEGLEVLA